MFRCPDCGQGKELHYRGTRGEHIKLIMNNEMKEIEDVIYKSSHHKGEAAERFVKMIPKVIGQECECPKCPGHATLDKWLDAYKNPLDYFEMEQLCHCGGELWMDQIPMTSSYGFVCEKCEWVKPNEKVSGA